MTLCNYLEEVGPNFLSLCPYMEEVGPFFPALWPYLKEVGPDLLVGAVSGQLLGQVRDPLRSVR